MTRIARYALGDAIYYGVVVDDGYRRLPRSPFDGFDPTDIVDPADRVRLLAPVDCPRVFGVGLNYVTHAAEVGAETPKRPMLFMKPTTAVVGPNDPVIYPREGQNVHYEAELAVVIGRKVRRIAPANALDCVLGYTCTNDISERVIQKKEMDMGCLLVGKGFDTFCPIGPVIATGLDPTNLLLEARVNGETRQSIRTSDLIFSVADLVSYLSSAITLQPGDVIITGTPSGVGPVVPGDRMEIECEGVGILENTVVAEDGAP